MPAFRNSRWRLAVLVIFSALLAACGGLEIINSVSPASAYEKTTGIPYGGQVRQRLDVYQPVDAQPGTPVVLFLYGGGWREGARAQYEFVASSLAEEGITVVIPDYRLYPEVRFPTFVEDAAAAAAWTFANISDMGGDPADVFLMGHSAGAHIAGLLVTDSRYLAAHGWSPSDFAGFIGLSGPYDFLPIESGYLLDVFPVDLRESSQPINFVSGAVPRTLLIHGSGDSTVEPGNSRRFADALQDKGVDVTLKIYDGVGHGRVVATLAEPLRFLAGTLDDCIEFIRGNLSERNSMPEQACEPDRASYNRILDRETRAGEEIDRNPP